MSETQNKISLGGFSKEAVEIVREMEGFGWVFRSSNHGVVGHAPHDKTTTSISRKLRKSNHSYQRAWAEFRRWLKVAHPELTNISEMYVGGRLDADEVAETNPVIGGILTRRTIAHAVRGIEAALPPALQATPASETQTENEEQADMATATITETPLHLKKSKDTTLRVIKRTWSSGRVDFRCAFDGCPVVSTNPRSITQHYGATHTRAGDTHTIAAPAMAPEPEESSAEGLPWEALADLVEELRESEPAPTSEPVTKQQIDAQYRDADEPVEEATQILMEVQRLVSTPLLKRMKDLSDELSATIADVAALTKERDEAREAHAKIQSDWDALRSLLGNR